MTVCNSCPSKNSCNIEEQNTCGIKNNSSNQVKNIIGVMVEKGGVGKSTVSG